jgi:CRP/FNR family cyclic AMP-dependent transcriptional regulator
MESTVRVLNNARRAMFLRHVPLFAGLSATEYEQLAAMLREQHYRKNAVIFHTHDPGNTLFLLTAGLAQMTFDTADQRELTLGLLYPGDFFGEMALLDDLPRSATIITLEPSTALLLGRDVFVDLLQRTPAMARKIAEGLSRRLRKSSELVRSLAFLDAHGKVARVMFTLAVEKGRRTEQGTIVEMRLTQNAIAKLAGVSRETTTHVLRDFQQSGYLRITRGTIIVLEQAMLAQIAHA